MASEPGQAVSPPVTSLAAAPRIQGACDCHMHVFGPADRFAYAEGRSYTPPDATLETYDEVAARVGLDRMVIVQPSVYGYDNSCTSTALAVAGPTRARGVAAVHPDEADAAVRDLHDRGFRGVRFITHASGGAALDALRVVAAKVAPYGWHVQLYVPGPTWAELLPTLLELPVDTVIDHLGIVAGATAEDDGLRAVTTLLDRGRAWIKLIPYRASRLDHPHADAEPLVRDFLRRAPERCLWGTDWPHPLMEAVVDERNMLQGVLAWIDDDRQRSRVLVDNPARLYGF